MGGFVSVKGGRVQAYLYATCIVWYASSSLAQPAQSSEPAGYRALIGEALAEFDRGHAAEARALFMRAHAVNPSARTLRGIGLASFELRDYPAAIDYLSQSLASSVNPLGGTLRESTELLLERARGYVGLYRLKLSPLTARLWLDGALTAPQPELLLDVGTHELVVEAHGFLSARHTVRVNGGEDHALEIALVPLSGTGPERSVPIVAAPTREEARNGERRDGRPVLRSAWLWTGVGVAVAAIGVAVGMAVRRDSRTEVGDLTLTPSTPEGGVFTASAMK